MQLAACVAESADQFLLDMHVDVFQFHMVLEPPVLDLLSDRQQRGLDQPGLGWRDQAHGGQHLGMGDRADDVVRVQPPVKADALGKTLDPAIRRLLKHSASAGTSQRRPLVARSCSLKKTIPSCYVAYR